MKFIFKISALFLFTLNFSWAEDWTSFRGKDRSGVSNESKLLKKWPNGGPQQLWVTDKAGLGYSGFSIKDGVLFTMGAFQKKEMLLAFNANSGEELWQEEVGELLTNGWGDGPRMSPTVHGNKVYALGGKGNLVCADIKTGTISWKRNLEGMGFIEIGTINRIESTFLLEIIYIPSTTIKRLVIYSNCKAGKEKF